ncbi:LicD family protein [Listeria booriae]|uniref:LicD family protein n=1 Tax=Listeria booriae TaxID=1552123 RepID=UPI0016266593|nr:LicD family protein [Listeria booriae]MBC2104459.1 LicD family protein [Listeria booriae]
MYTSTSAHSKVSRLRQQQLSILKNVVAICQRHNLIYFLDGGTLAGALMYNGFGIYDDDIDISMPREDFEKFISICQDELSQDNYLDYYTTNSNYYLTFAKVKNRTVNYPEKDREIQDYSHVFIDIFPLDGMKKKEGMRAITTMFLNDVIKNMIFMRNSTKKKRKIKELYSFFLQFIKTRHLFRIYYFLFTRENDAKYYINHGGRRKETKNQVIQKELYVPAKEHYFVDNYYSIPRLPEEVITTYGFGYMDRYRNKKTFSHVEIERL